MSSIIVGCLGGWRYFEEGSLFCDSRLSSEASQPSSFFQKHSEFPMENPSSFRKSARTSTTGEGAFNQTLFEVTSRAELRRAYAQAQKMKAKAEYAMETAQTAQTTETAETPKDVSTVAQTQETFSQSPDGESDELAASLEALAQAVPGLDAKVASALTPNFKPQSAPADAPSKKPSGALHSSTSDALIHIADFHPESRKEEPASAVALLTPGSGLSVQQRLEGLEQLGNPEPPLEFQVIQSPNDAERTNGSESASVACLVENFQNAEISSPVGSYASLPANPFADADSPSAVQKPTTRSATERSLDAESLNRETSVRVSYAEAAPEGTIPLALYRSQDAPDDVSDGFQAEEPQAGEPRSDENSEATERAASRRAVGNSGTSSGTPVRIRKPVRGAESSREEVVEKYELDVSRESIRKALEAFQRETSLKVVASLNVQGEVSCAAEHSDPEILLRKLLADTQFEFVREDNFIYVTRSENVRDVPRPLSKTETRVFTPQHVSIDTLELTLSSNLTQFGSCRRTRSGNGEALEVTDWTLSLNELEDIQRLIDVPEPENRMNAFAFQHELNGAVNQPLDLFAIAEGRGLVLQRMAIPELAGKTKKPVFSKKEPTPDIMAYSISHRADSFMVAVKDQLKVEPAWTPDPRSEAIELNRPMTFEFGLKVNETQIPYLLSVTFRENPDAGQEGASSILAEVDCRPKTELNPKSKPKTIHFTLPMPVSSGNSLVFQLNMGEFALENKETRKNPMYAFHGNRTVKEAIIVLNPFKEVQKLPNTTLTSGAVKALVKQQETLGRKFYGSIDKKERQYSEVYFSVAQKLRAGMNVQR